MAAERAHEVGGSQCHSSGAAAGRRAAAALPGGAGAGAGGFRTGHSIRQPMTSPQPAALNPGSERWQRFSAASCAASHAYASWLVPISWKRFLFLRRCCRSWPTCRSRCPLQLARDGDHRGLARHAAPPAAGAACGPLWSPRRRSLGARQARKAASAPMIKGVDINADRRRHPASRRARRTRRAGAGGVGGRRRHRDHGARQRRQAAIRGG